MTPPVPPPAAVPDSNPDERQHLGALAAAAGPAGTRAAAVRAVLGGESAAAAARRAGVHRGTAAKWVGRYAAAGPAGLAAPPRGGRPGTRTPAGAKDLALAAAADAPETLGLPFDRWTLGRLGAFLAGRGLPVPRATLARVVDGAGLRAGDSPHWAEPVPRPTVGLPPDLKALARFCHRMGAPIFPRPDPPPGHARGHRFPGPG